MNNNVKGMIDNLDLTKEKIKLYKEIDKRKSKDESYRYCCANRFYKIVNEALRVAYDLERVSDKVSI